MQTEQDITSNVKPEPVTLSLQFQFNTGQGRFTES